MRTATKVESLTLKLAGEARMDSTMIRACIPAEAIRRAASGELEVTPPDSVIFKDDPSDGKPSVEFIWRGFSKPGRLYMLASCLRGMIYNSVPA